MIRLLSILVLLLGINTLSAQIKVIDKVSKNISKQNVNTIHEIRADELEDHRIKIGFRSDTSGIDDYGEIYLNSMHDFEDLYAIINKGFEEKQNQTIKIDLGDSILAIYFYKPFLYGPTLRFSHSYKNALYNSKKSKLLDKKDILKLFNK